MLNINRPADALGLLLVALLCVVAGFVIRRLRNTLLTEREQRAEAEQALALAESARTELETYRSQAETEIRERLRAQKALRESELRYRALAARTTRLYTLSAALSEAVTLDAVAKAVVREGKVVAGASAGSVTLLRDGAQFDTLYAEDYARQPVEAWHRFPAEPGFCATAAVDTQRPVFIASFAEWQEHYPRSAPMAADGGYASAVALPLLVEGAAIGVLSFHFTAPVNFDNEYRAVLTAVAHHAAQAIDRARLYEAAQHARADAEAANRSKDDFLSIVSHELRTPLSAVLGWATMLRSRKLDEGRTSAAIESICRNATRQARLIDDLLDVSRIVAGRAALDLQEIDLAATVGGAVETIMPLVESAGLQMRMPPLERVRVVGDPHRLEQVFVNLLGNAVKFTKAGGTIAVESTGRAGDGRRADSGQRSGHRPGVSAARVRALPPGGGYGRAKCGRPRARTVHRAAARREPWRSDSRRERGQGSGRDVHGLAAGGE